jgi:hypothetical protein
MLLTDIEGQKQAEDKIRRSEVLVYISYPEAVARVIEIAARAVK